MNDTIGMVFPMNPSIIYQLFNKKSLFNMPPLYFEGRLIGQFWLQIVFMWLLVVSSILAMDKVPAPLEVLVKNVGQGNCIIVKMLKLKSIEESKSIDNSPYDILLVDCGTSAFKAQFAHTASPVTPKKGVLGEKSSRTSFIMPRRSELPLNLDADKIQLKIKEELEMYKRIKAVVITHPDKDHYSWVANILEEKEFGSLILGGAPEKYLNTSNKISKLIKFNFEKTSFTAVADQHPIFTNLLNGEYSKQPSFYRVPPDKFAKKINFNPRFQIEFLAINANHVTSLGHNPTTINTSSKEDGTDDYNTDSIIIKITDLKTGKSIILTGDATGVTTTRLMDHASEDEKLAKLLEADVLVASHHGSSSHGTNNEAWIRTVNPEFIILSTGGSYGHPTKKAYEAFHKSPRLATVTSHSVYVGGINEDIIANHITTAGIFSTLPHGDIRIFFPDDKGDDIYIQPENSRTKEFKKLQQPQLELTSSTKFKDDVITPVTATPTKSFNIISKIPEPKSYVELLSGFNNVEVFEPLHIDLSDHRNEFILDYLISHDHIKENELDNVEIFLIVKRDKLIGHIDIERSQSISHLLKIESTQEHSQKEIDLIIDLKDPRNLHLLRELKPKSHTDTIMSPSANILHHSPLQLHSPWKYEESAITSERSPNTITTEELEYSEENFKVVLGRLILRHPISEVVQKLKEKGIGNANRDFVQQLQQGVWKEKYKDIWQKLKQSYPKDFEK